MISLRAIASVLLGGAIACGGGRGSPDGGHDDGDGGRLIDAGPTLDGAPSSRPPGAWTEAGLDAVAGQHDDLGCTSGALSGRRYLYVDAAAAAGGDGRRSAPLRSVADAVGRVNAGEHAIVCIAEGTYDGAIGGAADVFADGREYTLAGGYLAGGGFAARDASAHRTHLRGPGPTAAVITFGNVRAFTLDGLEVSGGAHGVLVSGGYSAGRDVTVRNCRIHDNGIDGGADHEGGGVNLSGSSILIEHTIVEDNHGGRLGGGIFLGAPADAEQNRVDAGGHLVIGTAKARIVTSIVRRNTLRYDTPHGVGMAIAINSEVIGDVITDNHGYGVPGGGEAVGGGLIVDMPLATALIADDWIANNVAAKYGAGIFIDEASSATIVNDVLVDNVGVAQIGVDGRAGGDLPGDRSFATIVNVTIVGGGGPAIAAEDATVRLYDTLCATTGAAQLASYAGGALGEDVLVDGSRCAGASGAAGTITFGAHPVDCDPRFVDAAAGDYRPGAGTTCAGRGITAFAPARTYDGAWSSPPITDALGVARPTPPAIGAFEPASP